MSHKRSNNEVNNLPVKCRRCDSEPVFDLPTTPLTSSMTYSLPTCPVCPPCPICEPCPSCPTSLVTKDDPLQLFVDEQQRQNELLIPPTQPQKPPTASPDDILDSQLDLFSGVLEEENRRLAENRRLFESRPRKYNESDCDPIINENAIHWLICTETYESTRRLRIGENEDWELTYQDEETCVYKKLDRSIVIIGFRGTVAKKDLYDDALLSFGQIFPRAIEAEKFVRTVMEENPGSIIQSTGHSLGGAIARVSCEKLGLHSVTFNAAAPPTSPVRSCGTSIDYHIVFDVISAWQSPKTIRIDKGFDPITAWFQRLTVATWLYYSFNDIIDSHHLYHFSNEKIGRTVTAQHEDELWKKWWKSLPPLLMWTGVLGLFLKNLTSLPTIK